MTSVMAGCGSRGSPQPDVSANRDAPQLGADHDMLARLWVRIISVHYGAIARHWKQEGVDLLGEHREDHFPVSSDADRRRENSGGRPAIDDILRTGVFVGLQSVFERYDLIVSPTLAIPPVRNASDGNTIGPTDIGGEKVDPLIGWCMTFPINFTGHPAISVPAGLTPEGLPVGLQIIGRRHAGRNRSIPGKPLRAGAAMVPRLSGTGQRRCVRDRRLGEVARRTIAAGPKAPAPPLPVGRPYHRTGVGVDKDTQLRSGRFHGGGCKRFVLAVQIGFE